MSIFQKVPGLFQDFMIRKPEELNEWSLKWFQSQVAAQEPPPVEADEEMHAAAAKVQAVNRGRAARKAK